MVVLVVVLGLVFGFCFFFTALLRWNEVRYRKKGLPPGTMGWPVFGETTEFLKQGPTFMKNQRARYGNLFKSHILGCPTVVCMDPELNRFFLMNEGKGLVAGYPQSMLDILGKCNIASVHGSLYKTMRSALLSLINTNMIRDFLLTNVDNFMRSYLNNWDGKTVDIQGKTKEMALLSSLKQIISIESGPKVETFKSEFFKLVLGTLSLPIDLPGTNYRRAFQARKKILIFLREIMEERRVSQGIHDDLLCILLRIAGEKSENHNRTSRLDLSDEQILDLVITILYSGYETVSTTSMMAVKYLHDHPKVLQELREEHFKIMNAKAPEDPINWNDYKSMSFTRSVIYETMRMATIVNGVLRKTTQDMEMKGFVIPKGWKIYIYIRELNYDPFMYEEPLSFNPWRWQDKKLESHQHCLLFGGGARLCLGKELGIAEISMFLHYFVTRYRWEEIGGDKLLKFPRVEAPNGLRVRVSSY